MMNTSWIGKSQMTISHHSYYARRLILGCVSCLAILNASGCTLSSSQIEYKTAFGKSKTFKVLYKLSDEPILVLVDDSYLSPNWPTAWKDLTEDLNSELIKHGAAKQVIPLAAIENLRRTHPDLTKPDWRGIGQLAGASQVIWVELKELQLSEKIHDADNNPSLSVTFSVMDVNYQKLSQAQLWPVNSGGLSLVTLLSTDYAAQLKTNEAIYIQLLSPVANVVSKYFYDAEASITDGPS